MSTSLNSQRSDNQRSIHENWLFKGEYGCVLRCDSAKSETYPFKNEIHRCGQCDSSGEDANNYD